MVKKITRKNIVFVLLACCIVMVLFVPTGAQAASFSEITDMPELLESSMRSLGRSPDAMTIWNEFPYMNEYLGEFSATAYCSCSRCNGVWAGSPAANGEKLTDGLTIAVDPRVIPLGSYVIIEGYGIRKAQDTGSAIKGKDIDIYVSSHARCSAFGRKNVRVWIIPENVIDSLHRADEYCYAQ